MDIKNKETRFKQIEKEICNAIEKATSLTEINEYEQQEVSIIRDFLNGIDAIEYKTRLNCLCSEPQRVILLTVEELEYALDYLNVSVEEQQNLFEHEFAHFNEAKANGLLARFCLTFYKTKDGRLKMIPGTQMSVATSNALSEEERRIGLKSAITAPRVLSETDKQFLQFQL